MGDAIMSDNISIIGGADGPTSVFVAGKLGMNWLSTFGLVLVILLLIPNIIYAVRVKNQKNKCTNKFMNILEQIGRYDLSCWKYSANALILDYLDALL